MNTYKTLTLCEAGLYRFGFCKIGDCDHLFDVQVTAFNEAAALAKFGRVTFSDRVVIAPKEVTFSRCEQTNGKELGEHTMDKEFEQVSVSGHRYTFSGCRFDDSGWTFDIEVTAGCYFDALQTIRKAEIVDDCIKLPGFARLVRVIEPADPLAEKLEALKDAAKKVSDAHDAMSAAFISALEAIKNSSERPAPDGDA